jgi:hypothetical protein
MPSQQKQEPAAPNPKREWIFREFGGLNTQAFRTSIKDEEFSWLENAMPIGQGNIKVTPGVSASQQTVASGTAYYSMAFNVAGVDYHFIVCSDGSAYQIQATSPFTRTTIGGAGTFSASGVWAAQWKNLGIVIVDASKGYFDWSITTPTTLTTIDATKKNNLVAVFQGRVWMANSRTITFTDAGSYNNFAGSGGSFIMVDSTLHDVVTALISANNYLYIWGTSSCNAISDVRVVAGVAVFTNTNVQASAGTQFPLSVFPYYRAIMFSTQYGDYSLYGATPTKVSDELDGIIPLIDFTKTVSGAAAIVYNQLCAVFCFTYKDPGTVPGSTAGARQLLALYFNKKWFVSSQGTINFIWGAVISGTPTIFGTDGTHIFQLWNNTTANVSSTIQTKLYGFESSLMDTQAIKFGAEAVLPAQVTNLNVTIDTEKSSVSYTLSASNVLQFTGASSLPLNFVGSGSINIVWIGSGFQRYMHDVSNAGKYLGATLTSTAPQLQLTTAMMEYIKHELAVW